MTEEQIDDVAHFLKKGTLNDLLRAQILIGAEVQRRYSEDVAEFMSHPLFPRNGNENSNK